MQVRRFSDARAYLDRAGPWLLRDEAEHGLFLGVGTALLGPHRFDRPVYLATLEEAGRVVGCAFRTPPFHPALTRLPLEAVPALVEDVARVYERLPGVQGPESEAWRFAEHWCALNGCTSAVGFTLLLHVLRRVQPPAHPAPGLLRPAIEPDLRRVRAWAAAFVAETGVETPAEDYGEHLLRAGGLYLWEDGEPRCMVGVNRTSLHGATIGAVFTPPEHRGRGYAATAVADVAQRLLDAGRTFCTLYADLSNPTSNRVYRSVGFEPIDRSLLIRFS